jgi:hypothetical protein
MKCLLNVCIVAIGLMTVGTAAIAQEGSSTSTATPPPQNDLLMTQPASVNRSPHRTTPAIAPSNRSLYRMETLDAVAASFQVKPKKAPENSLIPNNLIPKGLADEPPKPRSVNPIDFFQVPAPNSSVKLRINSN